MLPCLIIPLTASVVAEATWLRLKISVLQMKSWRYKVWSKECGGGITYGIVVCCVLPFASATLRYMGLFVAAGGFC